jgi:hypothetical protein
MRLKTTTKDALSLYRTLQDPTFVKYAKNYYEASIFLLLFFSRNVQVKSSLSGSSQIKTQSIWEAQFQQQKLHVVCTP